jgi:DMSO/TMAO reductase YedYZ molybdopterin-dependent catalytic subunit
MNEGKLSHRALLAGAGGAALAAPVLAKKLVDLGLPGGPSLRPLAPVFPGKSEMIVQRVRPPLLEAPMSVFAEGIITPNDRHFVRWHWDMPTRIDAAAYRVRVGGAVKRPVSLTLADIAAAGEHVSVVAVNQCAGNGRGLSDPRVAGAQWGNGAMACAKWTGVRLRDVLAKAGLAASGRRVSFAGLDVPPIAGAPQFTKSIPLDVALRDDVLVAWGMNDAPLPLLNGYPLRIVVPGWFSTYWVKMLSTITVLTEAEDSAFFMAKGYRMPLGPITPEDKDFPTVPITTMPPRAFITSHADGDVVARGKPLTLKGIAMGGEAALARVDLVGPGWERPCTLGPDAGPYAFRRWEVTLPPPEGDLVGIGVRAANVRGAVQPDRLVWNPSGYARNVIERITLRAP